MEDKEFNVSVILAIVNGFRKHEEVSEAINFMTHGKYYEVLDEIRKRFGMYADGYLTECRKNTYKICRDALLDQYPKFKTMWCPAMNNPMNFQNWVNDVIENKLDGRDSYVVKILPTCMLDRVAPKYDDHGAC